MLIPQGFPRLLLGSFEEDSPVAKVPEHSEWQAVPGGVLRAQAHVWFINFLGSGDHGLGGTGTRPGAGLGRLPGALDSGQANGALGSSAPELGKGSGSRASHGIMFVNFIQLIYSCRAHEAEMKGL